MLLLCTPPPPSQPHPLEPPETVGSDTFHKLHGGEVICSASPLPRPARLPTATGAAWRHAVAVGSVGAGEGSRGAGAARKRASRQHRRGPYQEGCGEPSLPFSCTRVVVVVPGTFQKSLLNPKPKPKSDNPGPCHLINLNPNTLG